MKQSVLFFQVIIKSGRALIQGANRGMSPSKSVAAFPTMPNHPPDVSMTTSKSTSDLSLLHDISREEDEEEEDDSESVSSSSETESSNEGKRCYYMYSTQQQEI